MSKHLYRLACALLMPILAGIGAAISAMQQHWSLMVTLLAATLAVVFVVLLFLIPEEDGPIPSSSTRWE